jgi:hypothetical protein
MELDSSWIGASLYSPNGQWGCLTLWIGNVVLTAGFVKELWGADLVVGSKMYHLFGPGEAL